jgi:hypothetical protein
MNEKTIRVTCDTKLRIPLDELHAIQGNLKTASVANYKKFRKLIEKRGINFSLHVWKELAPVLKVTKVDKKKKAVTVTQDRPAVKWWIIDGHLRKLLLTKMRNEDGYEIPSVPCVEIEAVSLADAKKQVLAASSNFHKVSKDGLYEFLNENEMGFEELSEFDLPDIDLPKFKAEYFDEAEPLEEGDDLYSKKILAPVYEPKGKRPAIEDLLDFSRVEQLLAEINAAKIPEEAKLFLRCAAQRHTVFDYENIAEYYAHAPAEMQALMEKSALVIIDFQKAIENGFVALSEALAEAYKNEGN